MACQKKLGIKYLLLINMFLIDFKEDIDCINVMILF